MKRTFLLLMALVMVLGLSVQAHAALSLLGTDTLGNRLIYDDVLDITWYDYTSYTVGNVGGADEWLPQMNWAAALTVTVDDGGTIYDYSNWRLPSTVDPVGRNPVFGYAGANPDGSYSYETGWNLANSEMGYLYYTALGNQGQMTTSGTWAPFGTWGLLNTGDFQNLMPILGGGAVQPTTYWSATEISSRPTYAWRFDFNGGDQSWGGGKWMAQAAIAVMDGRASGGGIGGGGGSTPVPEPSTMLLLGSGLVGLGLVRRRFKG